MCTDSNSVGRKKQRVGNLIGKGFSCRERTCRIETDLSRKKINLLKIFLLMGGGYEVTLVFFFYVMFIGKVAIGKARCLLNIVFLHLTVQFRPFP